MGEKMAPLGWVFLGLASGLVKSMGSWLVLVVTRGASPPAAAASLVLAARPAGRSRVGWRVLWSTGAWTFSLSRDLGHSQP